MNSPEPKDSVRSIAEAIRRYLESRPDAAETLEGISRWWLVRQRLDSPPAEIEAAVEYLVARGELERVMVKDKTLYRVPGGRPTVQKSCD